MLSKDGFQFVLTPDLENVTAISLQHSPASATRFGVASYALSFKADAGPQNS